LELRQALDVRKAQRTDDVELVTEVELGERGADVGDLLLDAGDELRLIPAVDAQDGPPRDSPRFSFRVGLVTAGSLLPGERCGRRAFPLLPFRGSLNGLR
jgi:hypothetical protein